MIAAVLYFRHMHNVLTIVSYDFLPPKMGGQKCSDFLFRFLSPLANVTCATTKNNDVSVAQGYEVRKVFSNNRLRYINPFYFFSLKKIIAEKKITHVMLVHPYYGWLGLLLKWFCKVKLVVQSQNIEALRFKSMGKWWWGILWHYEKYVHRHASMNFFITDEDRNYAIKKFKLDNEKAMLITYGFELTHAPSSAERVEAKNILCKRYDIDPEENILLFNGTLDYKPNLDALHTIIEKLSPLLSQHRDFRYKIIICGSRLPASYDDLKQYREQHIVYAGFVDDITICYRGTDILINPVIDGGGIKTKVVEALGYNASVVSTKSGAWGIPVEITGGKMKVCEDDDWDNFAAQVVTFTNEATIPAAFFDHFYWGNIAAKAATCLNEA